MVKSKIEKRGGVFPGRGGFTLVELLVTVGIVLVLAALLASGIGSARMAAQRASCASNMRQIGMGLIGFCNDNNGQFPLTMHGNPDPSKSWIYTLMPYLDELDKVRICPADPKGAMRLAANHTSYILNEYIAVVQFGFGGVITENFTNLLRLPRPSKTITLFIISDRMGLDVTEDHAHSREWGRSGWNFLLREIQPDRFRTGKANADGTKGTANYLFADGHVENIPAAELKRKLDAGINPAQPPLE